MGNVVVGKKVIEENKARKKDRVGKEKVVVSRWPCKNITNSMRNFRCSNR